MEEIIVKEKLSEKDVILGYSTAGGNINLLCKQTLEKGGLEEMEENENVNELDRLLKEITRSDI